MQAVQINRIGQFGVGLWASGMILAVACLMVSHWVVLPHPQMTDRVWSTQLNQTLTNQSEQWTALHFLYGNCPCSRRILSHLVNRLPIDGCREKIVFIGEDCEMTVAAAKRGYEVDEVTPEELKTRYGVEAAPLLTVLDPSGNIRFAGGYTTHKQGPQIQDVNIIHQFLRGESVGDLPLFGCAVSNELKSLVDPLGLKK